MKHLPKHLSLITEVAVEVVHLAMKEVRVHPASVCTIGLLIAVLTAFRDRNAGSSANRSKPTGDSDRGGRGGRGRGDRGPRRGGDRHSRTVGG